MTTTTYSDVEYVFEPHSNAMPHLGEYVQALWERRKFMVALADADLRAQRSQTVLGNLWGVLDPLFQAAIYYFVYAVMRGGSRIGFLPILIADIFLFGLTTAALSDGGTSMRRAKGLMLNSSFPRALMPITSVYKNLRKFAPAAAVLVVLFPLVGGNVGQGVVLLPLLFALQTVMNIGIALLVSSFVTLVPDAQNLMTYVTRVLFFVTPVIYPVTLLGSSTKKVIGWQPVFALFSSYQAVFSGGVPSAGLVFQAAFWSITLLVIGTAVFLRHEREYTMHL